eukprot:9847823-Ditylum_brightwellii.AAC.1
MVLLTVPDVNSIDHQGNNLPEMSNDVPHSLTGAPIEDIENESGSQDDNLINQNKISDEGKDDLEASDKEQETYQSPKKKQGHPK